MKDPAGFIETLASLSLSETESGLVLLTRTEVLPPWSATGRRYEMVYSLFCLPEIWPVRAVVKPPPFSETSITKVTLVPTVSPSSSTLKKLLVDRVMSTS